MRNEVARLLELAQAVDTIESEAFLTKLVASATAPLGVTTVSVNLIVTPGRVLRPGMLLGQGWQEWSSRYQRERFAAADPAVRLLRDQTRPFTWTEAVQRHEGQAAEHVMAACRETTGAAEAFVVPVRESDGALLSAAFCGAHLGLDPEVRSALHLLGYYYATRGRELLHAIALEAGCPLTNRQIECLQWVLAGKTDAEIGSILHISSNTVHRHIELAKGALKVNKRGLAAHEAWRRGWLD